MIRLVLALALGLSSTSLWSQQSFADSGNDTRFTVGVQVNMITVPVTVRKPGGGFIRGLPKTEFRVLEDGVEQEIIDFQTVPGPLFVAIVVDTSGSVQPDWRSTVYTTKKFVDSLRADDQFALVAFNNNEARLLIDWGRDTRRLMPAMMSACCGGSTSLWDSLSAVCNDLLGKSGRREAILVMTDGLDNSSIVSSRQALETAIRSEVSVYVVSMTDAVRQATPSFATLPDGAYEQAQADLARLASETGGRVLYSHNLGQIENIYAEFEDELRTQYTLRYVSSNKASDRDYRTIRVIVDRPEAVVSARAGYFIRPMSGRSESLTIAEPVSLPSPILFRRGTPVNLRLKRSVSTETNKVGDIVELEALEEVRDGSHVAIQRGATAWATIAAGAAGSGPCLQLELKEIRAATGETLPLGGKVATVDLRQASIGISPRFISMLNKSSLESIPRDFVVAGWLAADVAVEHGVLKVIKRR